MEEKDVACTPIKVGWGYGIKLVRAILRSGSQGSWFQVWHLLVAGLTKVKFTVAEGWVGTTHWGTFKALILPASLLQ